MLLVFSLGRLLATPRELAAKRFSVDKLAVKLWLAFVLVVPLGTSTTCWAGVFIRRD